MHYCSFGETQAAGKGKKQPQLQAVRLNSSFSDNAFCKTANLPLHREEPGMKAADDGICGRKKRVMTALMKKKAVLYNGDTLPEERESVYFYKDLFKSHRG